MLTALFEIDFYFLTRTTLNLNEEVVVNLVFHTTLQIMR